MTAEPNTPVTGFPVVTLWGQTIIVRREGELEGVHILVRVDAYEHDPVSADEGSLWVNVGAGFALAPLSAVAASRFLGEPVDSAARRFVAT